MAHRSASAETARDENGDGLSQAAPDETDEDAAAALAADLATLGAEGDTERSVKRIVPWVVSLLLHGALVLLGFLATWTVIALDREEEPALVVADFDDPAYDPVTRLPVDRVDVPDEPLQDRIETDFELTELDDVPELEVDPVRLFSGASASAAPARFAPEPPRASATFVGLSSTNVRRIVYVIDASGSMIRGLPIVIAELARSLEGLVPEQEFSVVFFSRNEAMIVPPASRLIQATEEEKLRVLSWIKDRVIPEGRSNPLPAIKAALGFRPDVIFLLSENITGSGEFEIDQADLLAVLDQLNPIDPRTGRRGTQINCVQFLSEDELGTLKKIAQEHGGSKGYKFLDAEELGLRAP